MIKRLSAGFYLLAAVLSLSASGSKGQTLVVKTNDPWWKNAVIYEIYPRSFQDSNGDGVGDLNGICQRLDYLQSLGVDAIWLTPIFPSPQVDFGYDVSNYTAIDRKYGTMADFKRLMVEVKKRHMRLIMDLVLNHTSDKNPWFIESASSRTNLRRDWYVWKDGVPSATGTPAPPNNWVNRTEASAWRYFPETGQFNYHYFAPEQPDLNWRNPEVKKAMFNIVRFWLDKGVDGFRLDAINTLFEDSTFRDAPQRPGTNEFGERSLSMVRQQNFPEVHDVLRELRKVTDSYPGNRVLIGEIYTSGAKELTSWYGEKRDELQLPMNTFVGFANHLDASLLRRAMSEAEGIPNATPLFVSDNHDRPRSWDRYGDGVHNEAIAKIIATILLTTRSSALLYQGQEIGMHTTTPTRKEDVRDPRGIVAWPKEKGRDGERTPMQWDASSYAGFTTGNKTWLPIPEHQLVNVQSETQDKTSLLSWYRQLVMLRDMHDRFRRGETRMFDYDRQNALVWLQTSGDQKKSLLVAMNLRNEPVQLDLKSNLEAVGYSGTELHTAMSSFKCESKVDSQTLSLPAYGVVITDLSLTH